MRRATWPADHAPLQILRDRAALFTGAIEGEGQARRRVQPLQLAGNAKPRFVEMANLHFGHALADARIDLPQVFFLLSNPGHDAGRADQRRAEKIAQSLRGPILGYELLDIEIDRRGPDALAILSGRHHSLGKRRLRLAAAMRAAVDRGLMFRNHERALGKVEHLALLDPDRRLRFERRTAMAAGARLMPNHMIGIGGLPQRAALVALLPERPRRLPAIRGFFFNPSLEGGLELFELSWPSCRRRSATSAWSTAIWRFSEAINSSTSAGRFIPPLIQILSPKSPKFLSSKENSPKQWYFGLTPPWELPDRSEYFLCY